MSKNLQGQDGRGLIFGRIRLLSKSDMHFTLTDSTLECITNQQISSTNCISFLGKTRGDTKCEDMCFSYSFLFWSLEW